MGDEVYLISLDELERAIKRSYELVWDFHHGFIFATLDGRIVACNNRIDICRNRI